MVRSSKWPPNSFAEWMVGQNFRDIPPRNSSHRTQTPILKVEISENEASGDETLAITMPGRQRRQVGAAQEVARTGARKVHFEGGTLKSAMKKANDSSDTLLDTSEDDAALVFESSDMAESDTSDDEAPVRRRRRVSRTKISKPIRCLKIEDSEDSSAAEDALPHPDCDCSDCTRGRKILKAVIKFEAKLKDAGSSSGKDKAKEKKSNKKQDTSTEATDTSAGEATTTEPETTEDEKASTPPKKDKTKEEAKKKEEQKEGNNEKKEKQKNAKTPSPPRKEPSPKVVGEAPIPVDKNAYRLPVYPQQMQPQLIMPPHHKVMRVEHTLEGPYDPRPNAFFDSSKGIARVYHGPVFSNHMGELYGRYTRGGAAQNGPTPYPPAQFPTYYQAVQQPPYNWRSFPMTAPNQAFGYHKPDLGLPGRSPVPQSEKAQKAPSQKPPSNNGFKAGSDKAANQGWAAGGTDQSWGNGVNTWGASNANGEPPVPSANENPPADASKGWDTGSKQGGNSPAPPPVTTDNGWGQEPKSTSFNTDGGSKKSSNGKGDTQSAASVSQAPWSLPADIFAPLNSPVPASVHALPVTDGSEKPPSQFGGSGTGNQNSGWNTENNNGGGSGWDTTNNNDGSWDTNKNTGWDTTNKDGGWGANDNNSNQNTGWGANDNSNQNTGWGDGWNNSGGGGEQKPPSDAPPAPCPSKPASVTNDVPANGDFWNTQDTSGSNGGGSKAGGSNKGSQNGGWGNGGQGANNGPSSFWGGPPGSKAPSDNASRRGSNGKGGSGRGSPTGKGAFAWPENSGPPAGGWQSDQAGGWPSQQGDAP